MASHDKLAMHYKLSVLCYSWVTSTTALTQLMTWPRNWSVSFTCHRHLYYLLWILHSFSLSSQKQAWDRLTDRQTDRQKAMVQSVVMCPPRGTATLHGAHDSNHIYKHFMADDNVCLWQLTQICICNKIQPKTIQNVFQFIRVVTESKMMHFVGKQLNVRMAKHSSDLLLWCNHFGQVVNTRMPLSASSNQSCDSVTQCLCIIGLYGAIQMLLLLLLLVHYSTGQKAESWDLVSHDALASGHMSQILNITIYRLNSLTHRVEHPEEAWIFTQT